MPTPARFVCTAFVLAFGLLATTHAQSLLPPDPIPLDSLTTFRAPGANWQLARGVGGDPRREKALVALPGSGVLINVPSDAAKENLFTAWEHGDVELDLEFLLPAGSNSGIYLQGRYEIQLIDSWGKATPTAGDCGGIYQRWDATRPAGQQGYEGHAPRSNASRAPGLWQQLHIEFTAPRFDATGRKIANARFVRVALNGFVIHENVEVTGPTRGPAFADEKPTGPIMIQGDHGPIALRSLAVKRARPDQVGVTDVAYSLYRGEFRRIGEYDSQTPARSGGPGAFSPGSIETGGKGALVFRGSIDIPQAGNYAFRLDGAGVSRLTIDGQPVIVPLERTHQPGTAALTAGRHAFRLDVIHTAAGRPRFDLLVEGPGLAPQALTVREPTATPPSARRPLTLPVEARDRVQVLRGFVPFEPRKQLYAASIGSPAGVHYAYDFDTGALLRGWRGSFLDVFEMWDGRGINQLAKPTGPALTFGNKPLVALIEFAQGGGWPDRPESLWSSQGYTLEPDGQPVFRAALADIAVTDRVAAAADGRGLSRRLAFKGRLPDWSAWVLLADAPTIAPQPGGGGWIIGDREWYLDWPADAAQPAVLRSREGRMQLAVPLTNATLETPIAYNIVW